MENNSAAQGTKPGSAINDPLKTNFSRSPYGERSVQSQPEWSLPEPNGEPMTVSDFHLPESMPHPQLVCERILEQLPNRP